MTSTTCSTASSPRRCAAGPRQAAPRRSRRVDWAPLADVSETDGEYLIKAELPEVRKEDVSITVQDGVLTLSGERKQEKREDSEKVHRIERYYGSFARRFALPENADEQGIRAESRDGVIVIHIPKQHGRRAAAAADPDPVSRPGPRIAGGRRKAPSPPCAHAAVGRAPIIRASPFPRREAARP